MPRLFGNISSGVVCIPSFVGPFSRSGLPSSCSAPDLHRNAEGSKSRAQRRRRVSLRRYRQSPAVRVLEQRGLPTVDVPGHVLRPHARELPWHAQNSGRAAGGRRISGLLCPQRRRFQQREGLPSSKFTHGRTPRIWEFIPSRFRSRPLPICRRR